MDVDVICDIDVLVPQELGKQLHIAAFLIAVGRESVTENMLTVVGDLCLTACFHDLPSQAFVRQEVASLIVEYKWRITVVQSA